MALALERFTGGRKDIGRVHLKSLCALLEGGTGRELSLPGKIRAVRGYEEVVIEREKNLPGKTKRKKSIPSIRESGKSENGKSVPDLREKISQKFPKRRIRNGSTMIK